MIDAPGKGLDNIPPKKATYVEIRIVAGLPELRSILEKKWTTSKLSDQHLGESISASRAKQKLSTP